MEHSPIDSALILTTARVFDRPGERPPVSPLMVVGGLSLLQRTILTLQRGGITRCVVLGGAETEAMRRQLQDDQRVRMDVRWLPVREFPPQDPRTWEVLSGMLGAAYLVAGTNAVFPASLVTRVREAGGKGEPVVVVRDSVVDERHSSLSEQVLAVEGSPPPIPPPSRGRVREGGEGGVVTVEETAALALDVDLVAIPEGFTSQGASSSWTHPQDGPNPLQTALERGLRQGQVKILPLEADWYHEVRSGTDDEVAAAEWTLLRSLKGGLEGFVDRHFNRACSKWITLGLLRTPITPNGVTILATAVGLLAATAFAVGGYAAGLAGALLFQLSAVLDCCDGEVARLKFMESPLGERLDVLLDNVVHVALYAGMAWAAYHAGWGALAVLLGGLATVGNVAAFVVVQQAIRMKADLAPTRRRRVEAILHRLASRDFSVLILALALIGHVEWFLLLAAVGSNVFWPALAWQLRAPIADRK